MKFFSGKFLSLWAILVLDTLVVYVTYILAGMLRFNFELLPGRFEQLALNATFATLVYFSFFLFYKTYLGIIRHSSLMDVQKIIKACLVSLAVVLSTIFVAYNIYGYQGIFLLSKSISIIHFLLSIFFLTAGRLFVKWFYGIFLNNSSMMKKRVLIYGAGETGMIAKHTLLNSKSGHYVIEGFIDDNPSLYGKSIEGVRVHHAARLFKSNFIETRKVSQVILAVENLPANRKKKVIEYCLEHNLVVKEVPPIGKWIQGQLSPNQIKNIKIEDLLGREAIALDNENLIRELRNKTVLVTGAAGSIGSEIVRQIIAYYPRRLIVLDQGESSVYELELELSQKIIDPSIAIEIIVGDVTNRNRMQHVFETFRPEIVFHAAAYKHVPLMESNPCEAIYTNVLGTKMVADLSVAYGAQKFVLVSTDKAINPTNVMGCTKRVAEMYVNNLNDKTLKTQFVTTRFGNVLGSNGSVVHLFRKQIERGGPITITHKEITRYFMTIPEACNLVLEAGTMGNGGEIFVFDMGKSMRIYDLAKKMIQLSGLTENKDIEIVEVGLRPGEKLYEELLANHENTIPTHHPKILKATVSPIDNVLLLENLKKLQAQVEACDKVNAVKMLKEIVPEYKSNNSEFSELDDLVKEVV